MKKYIFVITLAFVASLSGDLYSQYPDLLGYSLKEAQIQVLKEEIETLKYEIDSLKSENRKLESRLESTIMIGIVVLIGVIFYYRVKLGVKDQKGLLRNGNKGGFTNGQEFRKQIIQKHREDYENKLKSNQDNSQPLSNLDKLRKEMEDEKRNT